MAVAAKKKKAVEASLEEQIFSAMELMNGLKKTHFDIPAAKELDQPTLWNLYYDEIVTLHNAKVPIPTAVAELFNTVADKLEELDTIKLAEEAAKKDTFGEDVVLPKPVEPGPTGPADPVVVKKPKKEAKKPEPPKEDPMAAFDKQMAERHAAEKKQEPVAAPAPEKKKITKAAVRKATKEVLKAKEAAKKLESKKEVKKDAAKSKVPLPEKKLPKKVAAPPAAKKTAPGPKVAKKKDQPTKAVGKVGASAGPASAKRVPREKDQFGFKVGTTVSDAAALMDGNLTLSQIAKELGLNQNLYYVVNRLRGAGHKVTFSNSLVTASAAKRKKS